ncbi:MAG: hypothetical protein HZB51_34270 [Chloroflexi bacterium]|nr:hypothetical protein [Chloroflexota bacterium]
MSKFRDRIIEIKTMRAAELTDNEGNWRLHPGAQNDAIVGILSEIGKADVLKAYYSQRNQGKLTILDGHLRKSLDPNEEWRVAILDITDEEADKLILVFDPIAAMAQMNSAKVLELTDRVNSDDLAVREMIRRMEQEARGNEDKGEEEKQEKPMPPNMDILPFEHYDYIVLFFKTSFDFERACDYFAIKRVGYWGQSFGGGDKPKQKKIGIGRAIDGAKALSKLYDQSNAETEPANCDSVATTD